MVTTTVLQPGQTEHIDGGLSGDDYVKFDQSRSADERQDRHPGDAAMTVEMTPYDRRAWAEIERWRKRRLSARARRVIPGKS
jgi:hypothetical protein